MQVFRKLEPKKLYFFFDVIMWKPLKKMYVETASAYRMVGENLRIASTNVASGNNCINSNSSVTGPIISTLCSSTLESNTTQNKFKVADESSDISGVHHTATFVNEETGAVVNASVVVYQGVVDKGMFVNLLVWSKEL
jgi:hypothetical protein